MSQVAGKPQNRSVVVRGTLWVEIDGQPGITSAGADLLEQIIVCGSLSEAARRLHFSYRRAWMLLESMNKRWPLPLVKTAKGGRHGGGAKITELGQQVLSAYRDVQLQLEHLLDTAGGGFPSGKSKSAASRRPKSI